MKLLTAVLTIGFLFAGSVSLAETGMPPLLHEFSAEFAYVNLKTKNAHATVSSTMKKKNGGYELLIKGIGNYDKYTNVRWTMSALMSQESGEVRTRESHVYVYDLNGKLLRHTQRVYDYEGKKIAFRELGEKGQLLRKRTYPMKGHTCDNVSIATCLKGYIASFDSKKNSLYILTNEPELYHVKIYERGMDTVLADGKELRARKFQVMADMGPLTALTAKLVPPTYFYFLDKPPFYVLQYEGLDGGLHTANVRADVIEHSPSL